MQSLVLFTPYPSFRTWRRKDTQTNVTMNITNQFLLSSDILSADKVLSSPPLIAWKRFLSFPLNPSLRLLKHSGSSHPTSLGSSLILTFRQSLDLSNYLSYTLSRPRKYPWFCYPKYLVKIQKQTLNFACNWRRWRIRHLNCYTHCCSLIFPVNFTNTLFLVSGILFAMQDYFLHNNNNNFRIMCFSLKSLWILVHCCSKLLITY